MSQTATIRREPSIPTLHALDLNWLIGEYIAWQRTQLDTQATVDCYACKLRWFVAWWEEVGPAKGWLLCQSDLGPLSTTCVKPSRRAPNAQLSWHSRNDVLRRLREMFHWANTKDYTRTRLCRMGAKGRRWAAQTPRRRRYRVGAIAGRSRRLRYGQP